jgi:hypothetical protein
MSISERIRAIFGAVSARHAASRDAGRERALKRQAVKARRAQLKSPGGRPGNPDGGPVVGGF